MRYSTPWRETGPDGGSESWRFGIIVHGAVHCSSTPSCCCKTNAAESDITWVFVLFALM